MINTPYGRKTENLIVKAMDCHADSQNTIVLLEQLLVLPCMNQTAAITRALIIKRIEKLKSFQVN